jgi:predicted secreted Zn-dependent protease
MTPTTRPFDITRYRLLFILTGVVLGIGACSPFSSSPAPEATAVQTPVAERIAIVTNVEATYYPVYGNTSQELFDYLTYYGPMTTDGERAVGLTTAKPRREWKPRMEGGACAIDSMTITVDITLALPRLHPSARLNAATVRNWQRFAADVEEHEYRHVEIYVEGFDEMRELLAGIAPRETCSAVEAEISGIWNRQLAIINDRQEQFHIDEDERVERERAPLQRQIEANFARMELLEERIAELDEQLTQIRSESETLDGHLDEIKGQLDAIAARYPNLLLPEPTYTEYQTLRARYNEMVPVFNSLAGQYLALSRERQAALNEHNRLAAQTAQLVEDYNWIQ